MPSHIHIAPDWTSAEAWLLKRVSDHLGRTPVPSARVVVPSTTLAHHLEERLLAAGHVGFFGRVFITFPRLIRELTGESSPADRPVPVPRALRLWGISRLVQQEIRETEALSRIRNYPGFVAAADQLIQDLEQAGIDPEAVAAVGRGKNSRKLQELGRIYAAYRRMLNDHGWTDEPLEAWAAAEAIRALPDVRKIDPLILYGLEDLTTLRLAVLRSLSETHGDCTFVVRYDPRRPEAFAAAASDLNRLQEATGAAATSLVETPKAESVLDHVQREVFAAAPACAGVNPDDSLQTLSASGPAQMIEAIARELRRLRQDDPTLQWKDCAVVFRSLPPYRRLIREIFPRFGIPFDLPAGTPWHEIAVLSLLRRILDLRVNEFEKGTFLACLRSACCRAGVDALALQSLAALLPAHALPEAVASALRRIADRDERRLEEPAEDEPPSSSRGRRIAALREAAERVRSFEKVTDLPDRASLRDYGKHVKELAESLICVPPLDPDGMQPAELRTIARDRRALAEFQDKLGDLARLWPHELAFDDLLTLLDILMNEEVLRDSFPRVDCVAIHDPTALRGLSCRIVVLAGLQEKEFPQSIRPGPFLKEDERRALEMQAGAGARLPSIPDQAAKEPLLFISALEAAQDRAYLAWTETDTEGRPGVVSPYLEEVRALVGPGGPKSALRYTMADVLPRSPDHLWHEEEACAWGLRAAYRGDALPPEVASVLAGLLEPRLAASGLAAEVSRWHDPDVTAYDGDLGSAIAETLAREWSDRPLSATGLDSFGKCPWQFFAARVLGLEAPEEEDVEASPMDRGRLFHRILERFYRSRFAPGKGCARPLGDREEHEALNEIHRIAEQEFDRFVEEGSAGHPGAWTYRRQDLLKRLTWFVRSEIERFRKNPGLAPVHLEFSFGLSEYRGADPESTDDPLRLIQAGREFRARGIVDRVDASPDGRAEVIDYKTGSAVPAYAQVADGTSSQLILYLLAAEQLLGLRPERAFYLMVGQPPGARGGLPERGSLTLTGRPPRGQLQWPDLRERVLGYLTAYALDIRKAHFPLLPVSADPQAEPCRYCDFRQICRVDQGRLAHGAQHAVDRFARSAIRISHDG